MKLTKKILAVLLSVFMLVPSIAMCFSFSASALGIESSISGSTYKIANDFVRFTYDADTGAFSFETKEGHPQKSFDNNIPLLYNEAAARSNGTSYTTVRIDGKDYIFGQDYEYFGIETDIYTPVITNGGRVMTVSWGIKGYLITQTAVISEVEGSDLAGNVGIGYTVRNTNDTDGTVGIRILLDNALDSKVDAPYVINDEIFSPIIVETEYSDAAGNMPAQISYVDSVAKTSKMAYAMLKGWSGEVDTTPDKVIVGHWANLANTRYEYTPDRSCDFSNYSNTHRVPDTATAIYWSEETVASKSERVMEMLYGIGNFTTDLSDEHFGLSLNVPSVKLDTTGTKYLNNGEIEAIITLDNSVDGALDLITANVNVFLDEGLTFVDSGLSEANYTYGEILGDQILSMGLEAGKIETIKCKIKVSPEANLTSKSVTVNVSATELVSESDWVEANYAACSNILVPGVDGILPSVKMTSVSPKKVYFEGEKNITVTGDMESLKALKASTGWEMYIVKDEHEVRIDKSTISFPGNTYKTMTFSTDELLELGEYKIEIRFTDVQLKAELTDKVVAAETISVCDDPNYRSESYGLVALVRYEGEDGLPSYDFVSFVSEEQLLLFESGEFVARGIKTKEITFDEDTCEVLAVVRGKCRLMTEGGKTFYQANTTDGDVTINNLLVYDGSEPLTMSIGGDWANSNDENMTKISGDGRIRVIGSITVWHQKWYIGCVENTMVSLEEDDALPLKLSFGAGGTIMQYIGGFLIDLKFGEFTKDDNLYGISFGGKITIPLKAPEKKDNNANAGGNDPGNAGGNASGNDPDNTGGNTSGGNDPDNTGGNTSGGNTSGGNTSGGNTSGGNTSGGNTSGGNTSGGNTSGGNTSGGNTSGGNTSGGNTSGGNTSGGNTSGGNTSGGNTSGGNTSGGNTSGGNTSGGNTSGGNSSGSGNSSTNKPKPGLTKPSGDNPPKLVVTSSDSKLGKYVNSLGEIQDEPEDGSLTAEIEDIVFGHKSYNEETGEYETGFVGINTTFEINLPADLLGGIFKNKFGVEARVTVNTLDKEFGFDLGVEVAKAFECSLTLEFKQITRKGVERYYPDVIKIYLGGKFMRIPFFGIPGVFVTGIGGGVSDLADALKDKEEGESFNFPTIYVRLDLIFVELLTGTFEGEFSDEYVSIKGEIKLNNDDDGKIFKAEGGLTVAWKPAFSINLYGNASFLDGLIKGGITVTIRKDYFYAYLYATLCIPDSIPFIGGKELSGFEAAGSVDFIGANLKIIGIKFGFIYYWNDKSFSIGQGIDLSGRGGAVNAVDTSFVDEDGKFVQCTALYGTNLRRIPSTKVDSGRASDVLVKKYFDPTNESALLLEVPFSGIRLPAAEEIILLTPSGHQVEMIPDDGQGGGNFLINDRGEGEAKYVYITITDEALLEEGEWTLSITTDGVDISNFEVNGVENLPELKGITYSYDKNNPYKLVVDYTLDCESNVPGALDVYITSNPNALSGIRKSHAEEDTGLVSLGRATLSEMKNGRAEFDIPDVLLNDDYYVLAMLTQDLGGMSSAMAEGSFTFVNDKLPENVDDVLVTYGGDGDMRIEVVRDNDVDYDSYVIRILDENFNVVENAIFEETVYDKFYNSETGEYENDVYYFGEHQGLVPGNTYYVAVDTIKTEGDSRYYSNDTVYSEPYTMIEKQTPVLLSVETNIDPDKAFQSVDTFEATYTFDRDVYFYLVTDTLTQSYSTECKKVHTVSVPLIEGDHVIDFFAVTPVYDTTDSQIHEEAAFVFTTDVTAPILKLAQASEENVETDELFTAVSLQNVVVGEDGVIELSGVTDPDVTLTLDGTTDGIVMSRDGSFEINRRIVEDKNKTELELAATDRAGNKTSVLIHLVMPGLSDFSSVELKADQSVSLVNDVKKITIPVGTTVNLSAFGINNAKEIALEGNEVSWKLLYEQNIVSFNEGKLTSLVPGETAVCVIYEVASFEVDGEIVKSTLTDVIVIEVTERRVSVESESGEEEISVNTARTDFANYSKIAVIIDKEGISSVATVIDGKETAFYYVGDNTFVASFAGDVSEEDVLNGLKIVDGETVYELVAGDFDGNGIVNMTDSNLALDTYHGGEFTPEKDAYIRGDVNGDGVINIIDAQLMLIYSIK